ncbi:efflux transporter outer membrane subunit [Inhella crocodyli]|uniref:Efflux transporter outer membrane subunit n=1 Tax=Inhella crocodyli TaxID=2499851 RepID=A0A3S2V4A5_9BURK|nr:efflux transporter outer membrane subunit [Inhella crocodyli]RVT87948.1 efflux transporter outer membrane subunit [Inhella crocodyli]
MKARITWVVLATAVLSGTLAGCGSLVPAREADTVRLRDDFRLDAPLSAATGAEAGSEWDAFFTEPRLRQVVGLALQHNRSLRASAAAVERVRAQYAITQADRIPDLDASTSATRQRVAGNTATTYAVSVGLARYEIDLFDRLGSLQGAALVRFLGQQETQAAARLSLVAEVSNAWLALAAEQQRLRLAEALRDSQQRSLDLTEQQYRLGAVSGLVRARAQTAFEAARGEAARSRAAVTQARLQLELLAGQPLDETLLPQVGDDPMLAPAAVTALPSVPAGLPSSVLLQRPDVRAAEQQLQAAAFDVGAARAARFPRLSLTATVGTRSPELDGLFKSGTGFWSLVPQLDLPLFDGGARAAQVAVTQASRQQAIANYEGVLQTAFREVADALAVRDSLAERLAAGTAQVQSAQRSLTLAEASYRLGASSQLEWLDAQRQLSTAQQALVTLRQAEQANRVALLRALGGRWDAGGPTP